MNIMGPMCDKKSFLRSFFQLKIEETEVRICCDDNFVIKLLRVK